MSWDVMVFHVTGDVQDIEDMTEHQMLSLGSQQKVIDTFQTLFPDIDFTDPTWGILRRNEYSIEFNMGPEEEVQSIMLHIRGGDTVIDVLRTIHNETGWKLIGDEEGIMDFDNHPEKGLQQWREYRDQVMNDIYDGDKKS